MKIWDAWKSLEEVHGIIFGSDSGDFITRYWLSTCELPSRNDLQKQLEKEFKVEDLQEHWIRAFGGWELPKAQMFLRYMMLFMIFGSNMACPDQIFDNGNLSNFFDEFPLNDFEREWAFITCFGFNADWQTIKSKTSKIIRRSAS